LAVKKKVISVENNFWEIKHTKFGCGRLPSSYSG
jgi:hypothetical protein